MGGREVRGWWQPGTDAEAKSHILNESLRGQEKFDPFRVLEICLLKTNQRRK